MLYDSGDTLRCYMIVIRFLYDCALVRLGVLRLWFGMVIRWFGTVAQYWLYVYVLYDCFGTLSCYIDLVR